MLYAVCVCVLFVVCDCFVYCDLLYPIKVVLHVCMCLFIVSICTLLLHYCEACDLKRITICEWNNKLLNEIPNIVHTETLTDSLMNARRRSDSNRNRRKTNVALTRWNSGSQVSLDLQKRRIWAFLHSIAQISKRATKPTASKMARAWSLSNRSTVLNFFKKALLHESNKHFGVAKMALAFSMLQSITKLHIRYGNVPINMKTIINNEQCVADNIANAREAIPIVIASTCKGLQGCCWKVESMWVSVSVCNRPLWEKPGDGGPSGSDTSNISLWTLLTHTSPWTRLYLLIPPPPLGATRLWDIVVCRLVPDSSFSCF